MLAAAAEPEREAVGRAAVDLGAVLDHPAPAPSVQDAIHFTYDDHQAATAMQDAPGPAEPRPRDPHADAKYALYFDPSGQARERVRALRPRARSRSRPTTCSTSATASRAANGAAALRAELAERLDQAMAEAGTAGGIRTSSR